MEEKAHIYDVQVEARLTHPPVNSWHIPSSVLETDVPRHTVDVDDKATQKIYFVFYALIF